MQLITDRQRGPQDLLFGLARAVAAGVRWVQIRDKRAPAEQLYRFGRQLQEDRRFVGISLFVNDRADVALALDAAGVHLAKKSLPPAAVRRFFPPQKYIGVSVHSLEEAVRAAAEGADYLTFGHVYATASHPGVPPREVGMLREVVEAVPCPVLAIGGITAENVAEVLETGCAGVAVIGAILQAPDPYRATRRLLEAMADAKAVPKKPFVLTGK
ncbi:MAG: thiamine phosphate synthase [Firmicutes bacterium]|nr:thiamine phosphate synthase [Bacillota bacterium]